jgi:formate/nitrite transporter FocA (FNT family)
MALGEAKGRKAGTDSRAATGKPPQKSYQDILAQEIDTGLHELERPAAGLLLSGLSAGLDVGFSVFLMGVMTTLVGDSLPGAVTAILVANMYAVGFVFVILGRSELFTEHTSLAVLPILGRLASLVQLLRLWGLVYVANLVGAAAFAAIVAWAGPALGVIQPWALGKIAHGMVDHSSWVVLVSGILAGWMMGLLSWLVTASRDTVSQLLFVWLVTAALGFCHFHHAIAGTVEVLAGLFSGQGISPAEAARVLGLATVGNVAGGVVFVAILKFAHATQTSAD